MDEVLARSCVRAAVDQQLPQLRVLDAIDELVDTRVEDSCGDRYAPDTTEGAEEAPRGGDDGRVCFGEGRLNGREGCR